MSAHIVTEAHIDYLLSVAIHGPAIHCPNWSAYFYDPESGKTIDPRDDPSALGTMLWHANHVSVGERYDEPVDAPFYRFRDRGRVNRAPIVAALKALDGYEYQSCEHTGWATSTARAFCEALRRRLISRLPGYDEATTWSIA